MASTRPVAAGSKTRHFSWELAEDGKTITCTAVKLLGSPKRAFSVETIHASLHPRVMQYGLKQLLSDRTAQIPDTRDKLQAMQETLDDFSRGVWSERATSEARGAILALQEGIARARGKTLEFVQGIFAKKKETLSEKDYKAWIETNKTDKRTLIAMAQIAAEKAAALAAAAEEGEGGDDFADQEAEAEQEAKEEGEANSEQGSEQGAETNSEQEAGAETEAEAEAPVAKRGGRRRG